MGENKETKIEHSSGDDECSVTGREKAFIEALKETLSTPSQEGGKTSRRVLMAFQVYHESDTP